MNKGGMILEMGRCLKHVLIDGGRINAARLRYLGYLRTGWLCLLTHSSLKSEPSSDLQFMTLQSRSEPSSDLAIMLSHSPDDITCTTMNTAWKA